MYTYKIPMKSSNILHNIFNDINDLVDEDEECKSYSITSPSLEELFIKLEKGKDSNNNGDSRIDIQRNEITEKMKTMFNRENKTTSENIQQIWSLVKLRIKLFFRNKIAAINTVVFPIVITVTCLLIGKYIKTQIFDKPNITAYRNIDISSNIYNKAKWFKESNSDDYGLGIIDRFDIDKTLISKTINYEDELSLDSGKSDDRKNYYGGFQGYINNDTFNVTIYHNDDYLLSLPIAVNLLNNALLSKYNSNLKIKTSFHFFERNNEKENEDYSFIYDLIIEYILVGEMSVMLSLLISLYGPSTVKERENNTTQQLYLNGMKKINYWFGVILSDIICIILSILLISIFGIVTDMSIFYHKGLPFTWFIMILWSIGCLLYQYLINYFYKSYEKSSTFSSIYNPVMTFIIGLISVILITRENDNVIKTKYLLYYFFVMFFFSPSGISIVRRIIYML